LQGSKSGRGNEVGEKTGSEEGKLNMVKGKKKKTSRSLPRPSAVSSKREKKKRIEKKEGEDCGKGRGI